MKTELTLLALLFSLGAMAQSADSLSKWKFTKFTADSVSTSAIQTYGVTSGSLYAIQSPKLPRTVKAGLMIANKSFSGRPRICIGTVIINADYSNTFFDHKMRPIDRKRILWAHEIKEGQSY